jgi:CheY-like chemotaxis protein
VGIAPNELNHIYEEFYQVGVSTNASRDGYGLGLSIVQRVVKLLDAGIDVVSQLGKGSTFSLVLPASLAQAEPAARAQRRGSDSTPVASAQRHVLLVEDDPGVRNATRLFLQVAGYRVTSAASLTEALEHTRNTRDIDLLMTDYHLDEGHTGTDVIAALRQELGTDLRAILVTGDTSSAVRELHRDVRLRLASKPIDSDELLGLMADLFAAK